MRHNARSIDTASPSSTCLAKSASRYLTFPCNRARLFAVSGHLAPTLVDLLANSCCNVPLPSPSRAEATI